MTHLLNTEPQPALICPHCGESLGGDVIVRCPICESGHHLACYAERGGCGRFACLGPQERPPIPARESGEWIARELYRADLVESIRRPQYISTTVHLAVGSLVAFLISMVYLMLAVSR